jgi:hypothetical protein
MDKDLLIGEIDGRKIYLTWKDVKEICNKAVRDENNQLRKFLEEFNALDVAEENQQLKELLRRCKYPVMLAFNIATEFDADEYCKLWDEIDNVIGEEKRSE